MLYILGLTLQAACAVKEACGLCASLFHFLTLSILAPPELTTPTIGLLVSSTYSTNKVVTVCFT